MMPSLPSSPILNKIYKKYSLSLNNKLKIIYSKAHIYLPIKMDDVIYIHSKKI